MHRNVLVVEDDYFASLVYESFLEAFGFVMVGPVKTIEEALKVIYQQKFAAALLDINMDGDLITPVADLLKEISCPFIFATGYTDLTMLPEKYRDTSRRSSRAISCWCCSKET